jgi:hypothetical protein
MESAVVGGLVAQEHCELLFIAVAIVIEAEILET